MFKLSQNFKTLEYLKNFQFFMTPTMYIPAHIDIHFLTKNRLEES